MWNTRPRPQCAQRKISTETRVSERQSWASENCVGQMRWKTSSMSLHHFFLFFFSFSLFPSLLPVIPRVFCMLIFFLPSFLPVGHPQPLHIFLRLYTYDRFFFPPLYIQRERPPEANELDAWWVGPKDKPTHCRRRRHPPPIVLVIAIVIIQDDDMADAVARGRSSTDTVKRNKKGYAHPESESERMSWRRMGNKKINKKTGETGRLIPDVFQVAVAY